MNSKFQKKIISPIKQTSEELFIKNYLNENNIKHIPEFKTDKLIDDGTKNFRKVDFYLPKLDIYLEHFGWYNKSNQHRKDYDEKARVYIKNNMPMAITYPHELGFLDYALHTKILKVLRVEKFKSRSKLFRYKFNRYFNKGKPHYFFLSFFSLVFTLYLTKDTNVSFNLVFGVGFATTIQLFWLFIRNFVRIFFYDF